MPARRVRRVRGRGISSSKIHPHSVPRSVLMRRLNEVQHEIEVWYKVLTSSPNLPIKSRDELGYKIDRLLLEKRQLMSML